MNFRLIPMSELSRQHFNQWPVWSEHYDYDEIEEIESWGVSREQFFAELEALNLGNGHAAYPVLNYDPLPPRMRIYIKARYATRRGDTFNGFVVNEGTYAGCIFREDDELYFNVNIPESFDDLALHLGVSLDELLPLRFETDCRTEEGDLVAGLIRL
jgi:hypothetical protein